MSLKKYLKITLRGDTIIESMFAFVIFGVIAVVNIKIMQHGARINQMALELNLTRSRMSAQAETLRLANEVFVNEFSLRGAAVQDDDSLLWNRIIKNHLVSLHKPLADYADAYNCTLNNLPAQAFILDPLGSDSKAALYTKIESAPVYPRLVYQNDNYLEGFNKSEGLWIEAIKDKTNPNNPSFYDFAIRSCWQSTVSPRPVTLETIVRLYVPR